MPDYSIDPMSIPVISAADVLEKASTRAMLGKDIVIGTASEGIGDQFFVPAMGRDGRCVRAHHRRGDAECRQAVYLGWIPLSYSRS